MTSYHGGKSRLGKEIAEVIYRATLIVEKKYKFHPVGYCEPFCGMLGVYRHIPELFEDHSPPLHYQAGDKNKSVIMMWQAIQKGWTPPRNVTEQKFNKLKHTPGDSAEKGYIGHQYGFNGHYFRSFAPNYGKHTNYSNVAAKLKHIGNEVADVTFRSGSYEQFSGLKNYIIYCDPPYESTTQHYKAVQSGFNSEDFYKWCRRMAEHNIVLISGYSAPRDFVSIHSSARLLTGYHSYSKGEKSKSKSKSKTGYRSRSHLSRGDYSHKKAKRIEHVYWVK